MDFSQYKEDVGKALEEWLNVLHNGSRTAAADLKESTGDLIAGFKESFPRRQEEIQKFVDETMEKFFRERESEKRD